MVEVNKPLLRHLAYLYLSFAHLTDSELSEDELVVAKERLRKYASPDIDIEKLMTEVIHWYNSSSETRLQVVNSIAVTFHFEMQDREFKQSILRDLVSIAKADKKFLPAERQFIEVVAKAWNIDFTIIEN